MHKLLHAFFEAASSARSVNAATLLVGLGSPHGNDQIGWLVAGRVARRRPAKVVVRLARSPADLCDWTDGFQRLVVCDACRGNGQPGTVYRLRWPWDEELPLGWPDTHRMPLGAVLELLSALSRLPPMVAVWGIEIGPDAAEPADAAPSWLAATAQQVAERLIEELSDA
jgi:hydrogenase maturation protease